MVPTQDPLLLAALGPFPSVDYLPAAVVAVVIASFALSLVLVAVRRHDAE